MGFGFGNNWQEKSPKRIFWISAIIVIIVATTFYALFLLSYELPIEKQVCLKLFPEKNFQSEIQCRDSVNANDLQEKITEICLVNPELVEELLGQVC